MKAAIVSEENIVSSLKYIAFALLTRETLKLFFR